MKIRQTLFFYISLFFYYPGAAQILRKAIAAPYLGTGAYSKNHVDAFSFTANQAALAQLKNMGIALYGERRFLLSELSNYIAVVGMPTKSGNFGLQLNYSGFSEYNETGLGLAYARKLGSKLNVGAQFNYHGFKTAGYGNASTITVDIATVLHVNERLNVGIQIKNPIGGKFGKADQEKLPSVYTFGIGYEASTKFLAFAEIQKEEDAPINVNAGCQYKFVPQFLARMGVSSATGTMWAAVGLSWKSLRTDFSVAYHNQLGFTPGFLLLFNLKNNQ